MGGDNENPIFRQLCTSFYDSNAAYNKLRKVSDNPDTEATKKERKTAPWGYFASLAFFSSCFALS